LSLCHPEDGTVSCGTCCGLFNLKLDTQGYKKLLSERTNLFKTNVDFNIRHTVASYRQTREVTESSYIKNDEMTYNCPYLGYVDKASSKIGCMIHPIFTGDPKSQNFSFYGTSICQAYDCKNKEHLAADLLESIFRKVASDSVDFSHLASDHILIFVIESWLSKKGWSLSEGLFIFDSLVKEILISRLKAKEKCFPTSFEIRYSNFADESEIYEYLLGVLCDENKNEVISKMKKAPARS
jgi:hypothetical protein